jgi:hypothetical protein
MYVMSLHNPFTENVQTKNNRNLKKKASEKLWQSITYGKTLRKTVPVYTMKAHKSSTDIAPHIPNLGTRWR